MNSKNLELYSVMAEYDGSGFLLSYCMLSTASSVAINKRTKALTVWAANLCDLYGVMPTFAHVDKDMAEIGMLQEVWKPKIQLCWWHTKSAVKDHMEKSKLSMTPYNVQHAHSEFPFISIKYVPLGKADPMEHEGSSGRTCDHTGFADTAHYESPNAVTLCIPIPLGFRKPPPSNLPSISPTHETATTSVLKSIQSTATTSNNGVKLTIKLPAGKENWKPETPKSVAVVCKEVNTDSKCTFCPIEH